MHRLWGAALAGAVLGTLTFTPASAAGSVVANQPGADVATWVRYVGQSQVTAALAPGAETDVSFGSVLSGVSGPTQTRLDADLSEVIADVDLVEYPNSCAFDGSTVVCNLTWSGAGTASLSMTLRATGRSLAGPLGTIRIQSFLTGDADPTNDVATVRIVALTVVTTPPAVSPPPITTTTRPPVQASTTTLPPKGPSPAPPPPATMSTQVRVPAPTPGPQDLAATITPRPPGVPRPPAAASGAATVGSADGSGGPPAVPILIATGALGLVLACWFAIYTLRRAGG